MRSDATPLRCRLLQALQAEVPERAVEATGLLLDLTERALNAFAAAVSSTEPSDAVAMQRLVAAYGAARQEMLQDALTASVSVCTRGAAATPETCMLLVCGRHLQVTHIPNIGKAPHPSPWHASALQLAVGWGVHEGMHTDVDREM